jgi:hypothetical protein
VRNTTLGLALALMVALSPTPSFAIDNDDNFSFDPGCPGRVTPFTSNHQAEIQVIKTSNFPDNFGPLLLVLRQIRDDDGAILSSIHTANYHVRPGRGGRERRFFAHIPPLFATKTCGKLNQPDCAHVTCLYLIYQHISAPE